MRTRHMLIEISKIKRPNSTYFQSKGLLQFYLLSVKIITAILPTLSQKGYCDSTYFQSKGLLQFYLLSVKRAIVILPTFKQKGQLYLLAVKSASSSYFQSKGLALPTFRQKGQFYLHSIKRASSTYFQSKGYNSSAYFQSTWLL